MSDFLKEFSIDDVVKTSDKRRFTAYGSVELYDRHNQLIPITEFYKSMDDYMSTSRILLDSHTNKPVGNVLNWTKAEYQGKPAIKLTGEIWKGNRSSDKVWKEIKEGQREGISVGGSAESIEKDDMGEVLRGVQIDEFSIVKRCGNQGAVFETISMAKSEEIVKQTDDMEQSTQDTTQISDNSHYDDKIKELEQQYNLVLEEVKGLKSLIENMPNNYSNTDKKMEKQEEFKKEEVTQEVTKEETPTENVEVQKTDETSTNNFNLENFAKSIQDSIDKLTNEVQELKKSKEVEEVSQVVKSEAPVEAQVEISKEDEKTADIMKQLDEGKIDRLTAMERLMEVQ